MYVDDIVCVFWVLINCLNLGVVYNVCDNDLVFFQDVIEYVVELLGLFILFVEDFEMVEMILMV